MFAEATETEKYLHCLLAGRRAVTGTIWRQFTRAVEKRQHNLKGDREIFPQEAERQKIEQSDRNRDAGTGTSRKEKLLVLLTKLLFLTFSKSIIY